MASALPLVRRLAKRLGAARRGAAALEFALVASAFLGVTAFLFDAGFVLYTQVALDFVASRAARMLAVDSQQTLSRNQSTFQSATVCPLLAGFLTCTGLSIGLTPVVDYANGSIPSSGPPPFNPGQGSSLMLLQITYQLPLFAVPLAAAGVFPRTLTVARFPFMNEY